MKITLLGTGTSTGVPELGCTCEVCTSTDIRDSRTRTSALIEDGTSRILIDCSPDFRSQMLTQPFSKIDAVLLTHKHYDHIAGLDDLRPFSRQGDIQIYADEDTAAQVRNFLPYCFSANKYPGVPNLELTEITHDQILSMNDIEIVPIRVFHGGMPILGYRIGKLAYITDMSSIEPMELKKLLGIELLIINALRFFKPHPTHQSVYESFALIDQIKPKEVYYTHLMHHIGLHQKIEKCLPHNIHLGYDGIEINL